LVFPHRTAAVIIRAAKTVAPYHVSHGDPVHLGPEIVCLRPLLQDGRPGQGMAESGSRAGAGAVDQDGYVASILNRRVSLPGPMWDLANTPLSSRESHSSVRP